MRRLQRTADSSTPNRFTQNLCRANRETQILVFVLTGTRAIFIFGKCISASGTPRVVPEVDKLCPAIDQRTCGD